MNPCRISRAICLWLSGLVALASWGWAACGVCQEKQELRLLSPKPKADDAKRAAQRVELGEQLYAAGDFAEALRQFDAARRLRPDARSGLLRARCLRKLERWVDAYRAYDRAQKDAKGERGGDLIRAAKGEQTLLTPHVGFVAVEVRNAPQHTRLLVNDETVPSELWGEVVVEPGPVRVELRVPFMPKVERSLALEGGTRVHVKLEPPSTLPPEFMTSLAGPSAFLGYPMERFQHSLRIPGHAHDAALLGAVGLGAYGVLDAMSEETLASLGDDCIDGRCPARKSENEQTSARQQTMAKIGLALGIVGMSSAVTLWVLDADADTKTTLRLTPSGLFIHGKL